jgi:hypothetical protein
MSVSLTSYVLRKIRWKKLGELIAILSSVMSGFFSGMKT